MTPLWESGNGGTTETLGSLMPLTRVASSETRSAQARQEARSRPVRFRVPGDREAVVIMRPVSDFDGACA